jgi:hypothetical protein
VCFWGDAFRGCLRLHKCKENVLQVPALLVFCKDLAKIWQKNRQKKWHLHHKFWRGSLEFSFGFSLGFSEGGGTIIQFVIFSCFMSYRRSILKQIAGFVCFLDGTRGDKGDAAASLGVPRPGFALSKAKVLRVWAAGGAPGTSGAA